MDIEREKSPEDSMLEVRTAFSVEGFSLMLPSGIAADFCAAMTWENIKMDHGFGVWVELQ